MTQASLNSFSLHTPDVQVGPDRTLVLLEASESCPRVLMAGDWASIRMHSDAARRKPEDLYGGLVEPVARADLAIVNLECVLGGDTPVPKDGPNLKGDPDSAKALKAVGFHLATLANNHMMDFGREGLEATLDICHNAGLETVGAGLDEAEALQPAYREVHGLRVGVLNLSDHEDGEADARNPGVADGFGYAVDRVIRTMREASDFCMVIAHGGKEYVPVPSLYWYEQLLHYAESGADLVVAHHPHVPQGMTWVHLPGRAPVPVIFSTGNFVFRPAAPDGANMPVHTADGYLVEAAIAPHRVAGLKLIPYRIQQEAGPRPLENAAELKAFQQFIETLSAPLADPDLVAEWFDVCCEWLWEHGYRVRVEGLTAKFCAGDPVGARHARNHHHGKAHLHLINRILQRMIYALPPPNPELTQALKDWFTQGWRPEAGE